MEFKQLLYFVEIVNADFNLSRAAEKLHITQPSLSMMISDLEKNNRIKFFKKKNSRYVGLTVEGEMFFEETKKIINDINNLELKLDKIRKEHNGTVKIGIPPIIISLFFNKLLTQFISKYPEINIEIIEEGANVLKEMLIKKEIDYAILVGENNNQDVIEYTEVTNDSLAVFVNNKHQLANKNYIEFQDLEDESLVLLSDNFVLHTVITDRFKEVGLVPKITFTSGQWDLLTQIVQDEPLITILPKSLDSKIKANSLKVIDFNPKLLWTIALCRNKNVVESPSALLLKEFIYNFYNK